MILGLWQSAYAMLAHAAANLPLPADVGMGPAHYGVCEDSWWRQALTLMLILGFRWPWLGH
ncbi:hypothetical protein ACF1GY_36135 [Streptomyces sp. NPDC014684]|uniref:hypothetical protein n=1 Tax=Streptomyces sp. NPDC014684 TaxID=3364880 RepID=UPI003702DA13